MADGEVAIKGDGNFEIFNTPSRGRGIKTKVPINKGTSVLSCEPYAFVSTSELRREICDDCLSPVDGLQRCSACKMVYYCDKTCQRKAWRVHKLECKHLKKMSPIMPGDTVRLLAALLLKNDTTKWLDDLVRHSEKIVHEKGDVFAYMLEMLSKYLDGTVQGNSAAIFELFCKINCNAFSICDSDLKPIGLGLYRTIAFLNHSCNPNCIAVFSGSKCDIRSIRDIELGEELYISYTELMRPQSVRRERLMKQYYFDCTCSRCLNEMEQGTEMNGLKCANKKCSNAVGFHLGAIQSCSECGHDVPNNYRSPSITKIYQTIDTTLSTVNRGTQKSKDARNEETLRICEHLLHEVEDTLHAHNYLVIRIVEKIYDVCIGMALWDKAMHYSKRLLDGYLKFYPKYHPSIATQFFGIGKLELLHDKLDAGISSLSQARALLEVCYGKQHSLTTQVNQIIWQTVQEKSTTSSEQNHLSMID